ncbi:MAG: hypothetical protein ACK46X_13910 [Candidatus Sericytochromatia bacterium]
MSRHPIRHVAIALPLLAVLAGCDVPSVPGIDVPGPTLRGQVKGETSSNLRVGLLGTKTAGAPERELRSAAVGSDGSYTLQLPNSPPLDLMVNANDSVVFTLTAYEDTNKSGSFDPADKVTDAVAQSGRFRFFVEDGPPGSYKSGWNLYNNTSGTYSQSFETAFVLQGF